MLRRLVSVATVAIMPAMPTRKYTTTALTGTTMNRKASVPSVPSTIDNCRSARVTFPASAHRYA